MSNPISVPVGFNLGSMIPKDDSPYLAQSLMSSIAWKAMMESKPAGDSHPTPSEMERVSQSTSPKSNKGTDNGKGLVASGPVSFEQIYSTLNATLRRGGKYKNGAIVLHLDANHADVDEFITTPRELLPWAKRCVNITQEWWDNMDAITRQETY